MRFVHARSRICAVFAAAVTLAGAVGVAGDDKNNPKPSVSLKASPQVGFSPLRVVLTAELKGGANDFQEFYCPAIEWFWDDDTKSESQGDCEPYEPGKSEIKRRYTIDRVFNTAGEFRVEFRLKQRGKTVGMGKTSVRVRPGIRDGGGS